MISLLKHLHGGADYRRKSHKSIQITQIFFNDI